MIVRAFNRREFLHAGLIGGVGFGYAALAPRLHATVAPATYSVRDFGATGDGRSVDTAAVNKAIDAAAAAGGGTVLFPAGQYLCYSIRLKSHVSLFLDHAATIIAADQPPAGQPGYDEFEPNQFGDLVYQDFGHSHWRNSLIWGEGLDDIAILGTGRIWGRGLLRNNIVSAGSCATNIAIDELAAGADPRVLQNNDLWSPITPTALYRDEAANNLGTIAAVNALGDLTVSGNISADPLYDGANKLQSGSPCRDTGIAAGAPAQDFEGDTRPKGPAFDIGHDEF